VGLAQGYGRRRDRLYDTLNQAGFKAFVPRGAYYMMTDISRFGFRDDVAFTQYLVKEVGIAAVPGSSFYSRPGQGAQQVRFAFCKKDATLEEAARRLLRAKKSN
jgi:aminotransferase